MATSGDTSFNVTRAELIRMAALKLGAIGHADTMQSAMSDDFNRQLNAMVKRWSGTGIKVWTVREAVLFPAVSQVKYTLSSSSTDHAAETYYATTLSAAEASGQTVLSATSTANMTVSDYIGIVLDDGTLHWSTVSSKTSTEVTIASGLASAAASGNAVFNYTTKLVRPLRIPNHEGAVRRYTISSGNDTPIGPPMARLDYHALPQKTTTGSINQVFYDPQLTAGYLYIWQPLATITDLVKFTWHKPIEDFDSAGDNPDLPQEWIDTLVFNLALAMAPEFDVPNEKVQLIAGLASQFLDDLSGFGREIESVYFAPDLSPR